ncbi:MAG: hypothetical protein R3F65_12325 [bacterium]
MLHDLGHQERAARVEQGEEVAGDRRHRVEEIVGGGGEGDTGRWHRRVDLVLCHLGLHHDLVFGLVGAGGAFGLFGAALGAFFFGLRGWCGHDLLGPRGERVGRDVLGGGHLRHLRGCRGFVGGARDVLAEGRRVDRIGARCHRFGRAHAGDLVGRRRLFD